MSSVTFEDIKQDRERGAKWLITIAWLVEICASSIGFYFAFVTATGTRKFLEENQDILLGGIDDNVRLAMLPFIIVGLVELTKIPLAYAAYHTRARLWRIVFIFTLSFLCVLTTETVFTGMERSLNNQMSLIADDLTEQGKLKAQITSEEEDRDQVLTYNLSDLEDNFNKVSSNINRELNNKLEEIESTRSDRESELQKRISLQTEIFMNSQGTQVVELESQRDQYKDMLNQQINERDDFIDSIRTKAVSDREAQRKIISDATNTINSLSEQLTRQLDGKIFTGTVTRVNRESQEREFTRRDDAEDTINIIDDDEKNEIDGIRQEYISSLEEINNQILILSEEIKVGRGSNEESFSRNQKILQNQLEQIEDSSQRERERVIAQNEILIGNENKSYGIERSNIEQRRSILNDLENKIIENKNTLIQVERTINKKSEQIQVLRFAKRWGDRDSYSEIQSKDIAAIMLIWFGSISFIAAVTGTVIAFASFVLKDKEAFKSKPKRKTKKFISNSLRIMLLNRRKFYKRKERGVITAFLYSLSELFVALKNRLIRPVIKKEYIHKDIEKIVEVPIETVKKELVYVPFYSVESGTLDLSGEVKDMTNAEDIKNKINKITTSLSSHKGNSDEK